MKKQLKILLVALLIVPCTLMFAACGSNGKFTAVTPTDDHKELIAFNSYFTFKSEVADDLIPVVHESFENLSPTLYIVVKVHVVIEGGNSYADPSDPSDWSVVDVDDYTIALMPHEVRTITVDEPFVNYAQLWTRLESKEIISVYEYSE